jgi:hypothetical protein
VSRTRYFLMEESPMQCMTRTCAVQPSLLLIVVANGVHVPSEPMCVPPEGGIASTVDSRS